MPSAQVNGVAKHVPGVYSYEEVVFLLSGAQPTYLVPTIIGGAAKGIPYDVRTKLQAGEPLAHPYTFQPTSSASKKAHGAASELAVAHEYAQRAGLPFAYNINPRPLTRPSIVADASATNQFTLYTREFGAPMNGTFLRWNGGVLSIQHVRSYSEISVDVSAGDKRIYLEGKNANAWCKVGSTYYMDSNTVNAETIIIKAVGQEVQSDGTTRHYVEVETGAVGTHTTANYARIFDLETALVQSPQFAAGECQDLIDWINDNTAVTKLWAVRHANFTGALPDDIPSLTNWALITQWTSVVEGTSPAESLSDHQTIISDFDDSERTAFLLATQLIPRVFLLLSDEHSVHTEYRTWIDAHRAAGRRMQMFAGTRFTDLSLSASNDTSGKWRAQQLNSQSFALWVGQVDRLKPGISFAAQMFGRYVKAGTRHNLTKDELLYETIGKIWTEAELETINKFGLNTYKLQESSAAGPRFVNASGHNTNQNNANSWDEASDSTPLVYCRGIADQVEDVLAALVEAEQQGEDVVTQSSLAALLVGKGNRLTKDKGLIDKPVTISEITLNDSGTGFDIVPAFEVPSPSDFIVLKFQIVIGA